MSEVESHYGADPVGLDRKSGRVPEKSETGPLDRAGDALKDAAATAQRAAERVRDTVSSRYDRATEWASGGYDSVSRNATYARRRSVAELNRGRRGLEGLIEENPIMVGVAGLAAGLLIGALLPGTRQENKLVGRYADEARREGLRYAQDVAQQGRAVIEENLRDLAPRGSGGGDRT